MAKGQIAPLISTHVDQRDGTRYSPPPPVSDRGNARFDSYVNAPVRVGDFGSGTPDPKFNLDRFVYQGAFWIRDAQSSKNLTVNCFIPPNGNNGSVGSLILSRDDPRLYEYQIPDTLSTQVDVDYTSVLPESTRLQGGIYTSSVVTGPTRAGWGALIGGKYWVSVFDDYESGESDNYIIIYDDPTDLENSTASVVTPSNGARTARYMNKLDSSWATTLGNEYFAGIFYNISIVGRASTGPSFYTFDFSQYTPGDSDFSFNQILQYGSTTRMSDELAKAHVFPADMEDHYKVPKTSYNGSVNYHYQSQFDMSQESWFRLPTTNTTPEPENNKITGKTALVRMSQFNIGDVDGDGVFSIKTSTSDPNVHLIRTYYSGVGGPVDPDYYLPDYQALIPDDGVLLSTLVVKSEDGNTTYTEGVDYYIKDIDISSATLRYKNHDSTFSLIEDRDVFGKQYIYNLPGGSISDDQALLLEYDHLTQRFENMSYYSSPATSVVNNYSSTLITCGAAIHVPNTDTILLIGGSGGHRFGIGYKSVDTEPRNRPGDDRHSGGQSYDYNDHDSYFWALNLNDIKAAKDSGDVDSVNVYSCGIFDNRWLEVFEGRKGKHYGGAWDESTNTLYISCSGKSVGYSNHTIISAYKYI
jgi:hypothetical protein